jgi:hypothetical protein
MRRRLLALYIAPALLLGACHGDRQPGATTASEDKQLDDAAVMLDANSMEVNAIDTNSADDSADDSDGNNQ